LLRSNLPKKAFCLMRAISWRETRWGLSGILPRSIAAIVVVLVAQSAANGQEIKFDEGRASDKFTVEAMLRSGNVTEEAKFDGYFNFYILPPLAKIGPAGQTNFDLPQIRQEVKRLILRSNGNAHDRLNQLVREFVNQKLVRVRDPGCRVNALLVLGDLNESEQAGPRPAKPLPAALQDLVNLLRMPRLPDYMRVPAMVGVQRHAGMKSTYPLDPAVESQVSQLMLAILKEEKVPATRQPSGHYYLRGLAAEILGALGQPGKGGENVMAVKSAMDEPQAPLMFRVGLCKVIGMFDYSDPNLKLDYPALAVTACYAAFDAAQKEFERVDKLTQLNQQYVDPDRRKLSYFFRQAYYALNGVSPRAGRAGIVGAVKGKPQAQPVLALQAPIAKVLKHLDENEVPNGEKLRPMTDELKVALPQRAEAAKIPVGVAGAKDKAAPKN